MRGDFLSFSPTSASPVCLGLALAVAWHVSFRRALRAARRFSRFEAAVAHMNSAGKQWAIPLFATSIERRIRVNLDPDGLWFRPDPFGFDLVLVRVRVHAYLLPEI